MKESFQECSNLDGRNQLEIANLKDSDGRPILPNTRKKLITDSQIQLQTAEQRYKCLADASFEAIMIHGKGKIIDFNQRFVDLHGYSREELLTLNSAELIAPEYRDLVTEKMASGFQGTYEIVAIRKDGTTFPLEVRVRTMGTQDRALRIVVGRDLTEQRQKEQQLETSKERFKRLTEAAFEAIAIHQKGRIIDVNQQYLDMFGYTLDEVKQIDGIDMIAPQSRELVTEKMTSGYEGAYEAFGLKKDGTIFPIEVRAKETTLDDQLIRIGAIRDLTEQKQQEEKFKAIFESSQDYIVVWDRDYNYLYSNQAAIDHAKTTRGKIIGKNIRDVLAHLPKFMQLCMDRIDAVFATGKATRVEDTIIVDGQVEYGESVLSPIRYPGGEMSAVSCVYRDITDLKCSKERFERLAEVSNDGVLIYCQNMILDANQQFLDMFGYTLEEAKHIGRMELIAPQSRELAQKLMDSEFLVPLESFAVKKDGTVFPVEVNHRKTLMDGQTVMIGTVRDMTQQQEQQQQFKASQEHYKRLSNAAFEAICIHQQGKIHDVNIKFMEMFGYTFDELQEMAGIDLFAPQSQDMIKNNMGSGYEGAYEAFGRKKDGTIFPIEICAKNSTFEGEPARIGAIRDLSEKKEMQRQLVENEKSYRELYGNAAVALYRTRISDGKIIMCNTATAKIMGFDTVEEYIGSGLTALALYVDKRKRQELLEQLEKNNRADDFQIQIKRKDGRTIWISLSAETSSGNDYMEGTITDITARKCLTKAEDNVLDQLMQGKSNKEIARELGRSVRTVEDHRSHIMHKLGVDNIVDLAQIALSLPKHHNEESEN